jgi:hypothetical protein
VPAPRHQPAVTRIGGGGAGAIGAGSKAAKRSGLISLKARARWKRILRNYVGQEGSMLRAEQNKLVTQTGPGTPMGLLFRCY